MKKVLIHPDYERVTHQNDIALLQLNEKPEFSPICLPSKLERYENNQKGVNSINLYALILIGFMVEGPT